MALILLPLREQHADYTMSCPPVQAGSPLRRSRLFLTTARGCGFLCLNKKVIMGASIGKASFVLSNYKASKLVTSHELGHSLGL